MVIQGRIEMKAEGTMTEMLHARNILHDVYGFDFSGYSEETIIRRTLNFMTHEGIDDAAALVDLLRSSPDLACRYNDALTVNYTEMFRDPGVFRKLRDHVFPYLATYPSIRIWCAGCSSGEEAHSLAMMLHVCGLLERTTIYATDISLKSLDKARNGVYSPHQVRAYRKNFLQAGIGEDFSRFFMTTENGYSIRKELRDRIIFFDHNLLIDESPNEFHLILCRNVFIYFRSEAQHKATRVFTDSLVNLGYLCLGAGESLTYNPLSARYASVDKEARIYRRVDS